MCGLNEFRPDIFGDIINSSYHLSGEFDCINTVIIKRRVVKWQSTIQYI